MKLKQTKIEVMNFLAKNMDQIIHDFLKKIDTNWQPSDFLPDSSDEDFTDKVKTCRSNARNCPMII
jgi:acyl-[acyl-carrier-protein] desaturase